MSRIERKFCLISTSFVAGSFAIFILLHMWQNCVCFVDFLPMRTLCDTYHAWGIWISLAFNPGHICFPLDKTLVHGQGVPPRLYPFPHHIAPLCLLGVVYRPNLFGQDGYTFASFNVFMNLVSVSVHTPPPPLKRPLPISSNLDLSQGQ